MRLSLFHFISLSRVKTTYRVQNFFRADYAGMTAALRDVDWISVLGGFDSIDDLYSRFCSVILELLPCFVPMSYRRSAFDRFPDYIRRLVLHKQALFTKCHIPAVRLLYLQAARDLSKLVSKFIRNRERCLFRSKRGLYSYVGNRIKTKSNLSSLCDPSSGRLLLSDASRAEALANHFSSVFKVDDGSLPPVPFSVSRKLSSVTIYPWDVFKVLCKLKPSVSATPDSIPQILFKKCAYFLAEPLAHIFNISLETGSLPSVWLQSFITPVPKRSRAKLPSDYRPIAIGCTALKVLERLLHPRLEHLFHLNNVVQSSQFGFLSASSVELQLLSCLNDWTTSLASKQLVDVVYFDLKAAFDTVSHPKLVHLLSSIGVEGSLLNWIAAFLSPRTFAVKVGSSFSTFRPVFSGVPQGSVLGPLLFLAYMGTLEHSLKSCPGVSSALFADDVKLYISYTASESVSAHARLQLAVDSLRDWVSHWQLDLSIPKCFSLFIGSGNPRSSYSISGSLIDSPMQVRDLGIFLNSALKPFSTVDAFSERAMCVCRALLKAVTLNDAAVLVLLYKTYVLPLLSFSSAVWSPYLVRDIRKVENVQRYFTRVIFYRCFPSSSYPRSMPQYSTRLSVLKLQPLSIRRIVADLVLAFKILRSETRLKSSRLFCFQPCRTRGSGFRFYAPVVKNCLQRYHFFSLRTARWLNRLPLNVLSAKNAKVFKRRLLDLNICQLLDVKPSF